MDLRQSSVRQRPQRHSAIRETPDALPVDLPETVREMLVSEIMTPRPVTGSPTITLDRAATVMRRNRFRHLPILTDRRLTGVLSDRDVRRALAAGTTEKTPVAEFVRRPTITTTPDTPVEQVARLLQEDKIGCVPVVSVRLVARVGTIHPARIISALRREGLSVVGSVS